MDEPASWFAIREVGAATLPAVFSAIMGRDPTLAPPGPFRTWQGQDWCSVALGARAESATHHWAREVSLLLGRVAVVLGGAGRGVWHVRVFDDGELVASVISEGSSLMLVGDAELARRAPGIGPEELFLPPHALAARLGCPPPCEAQPCYSAP